MYISPTEAIRQYKVSKPTLYSDMKGGKLSFGFDDRKRRRINVAELDRLYEKRPKGEGASKQGNVSTGPGFTGLDVKELEVEVKGLKLEVKMLGERLEEKKELAEKWERSFEKMLAQHSNDMLLLKDQSKSLEGRAAVERKAVEEQLKRELAEKRIKRAAQKIRSLEEANRELRARNSELKNRGFFGRIFGWH